MVLIFSIQFDYSTSCVIKWLNHWGIKVVRINGDDDTYKLERITDEGIYFKNFITNEVVNLLDAKSCWWRRTGITTRQLNSFSYKREFVNSGLDLSSFIIGKNNYLDDEAKALTEYIFYSVYKNTRINLGKPVFNLNRLIVLDIAKKHGLNVPSFEVVNNTRQLYEKGKVFKKMVTKAVSNGIYRDVGNHRFYSYTELLDEDFVRENEDATFFPSLVSSLVEKELEIRSFYIDGEFYSMAIFSQKNEKTKIDFRKYSNNRNEPFKLPKEVESRLENVFKELDLNCGSIDLIIDKKGEYIFLEINPVGQFGMTSEPCNYNLHKTVAKYLKDGTRTN